MSTPWEVMEKVHLSESPGNFMNLTGYDLFLSTLYFPPTKVTRWTRIRWAVADWLRRVAMRIERD